MNVGESVEYKGRRIVRLPDQVWEETATNPRLVSERYAVEPPTPTRAKLLAQGFPNVYGSEHLAKIAISKIGGKGRQKRTAPDA